MTMPKCSCQWIDSTGTPTPDDNEAIALAVCHDPRSFGEKGSEPFPICEAHAKLKGEFWKLYPLDGQIPLPGMEPADMHPLVRDDHRYFVIITDVVINAIKKSFPDQAQDILKGVRKSRDHFFFNRWGMYVGVEFDGHIHT
jgi:hypothetical protein